MPPGKEREPPPYVRSKIPLAKATTFHIGGPARWYAEPHDLVDLGEILSWVQTTEQEFCLLGRGSNMLIPDEGLDAVVIHLAEGFAGFCLGETGARAGGATSLPRLAIAASRAGFGGMEKLVGIPATVGGAVAMNAGCLGAEMKDIVRRVRLMTAAGKEGWVPAREMDFAYRTSRLQQTGIGKGEICIEVELHLVKENPDTLMRRLRQEKTRRHKTQPYEAWTAGSVFKNPSEEYAGQLIESCGLKGKIVGDAMVSGLHANFIVNRGQATAQDVVQLMGTIQREVFQSHGVLLKPELALWGHLPELLQEASGLQQR